MAAGADPDRIVFLNLVTEEKVVEGTTFTHNRQLRLAEDTRLLRDTLKANPNIAMVGIDPITGFFGDADPNKDMEIRPVMEAINHACEKSGAAFVAVIHHNKRSDVDALQKILGASSVAGVSRAAWGFSRDPEDKEILRMSRIKGNLSKKRTGMKYKIVDKALRMFDGTESTLPVIEWAGECDEDADQLIAQDREKAKNGGEGGAVTKALGWLKYRLKDKPVESTALFKDAELAGINAKSIYRAKKDNADLFKCNKAPKSGEWWWRLLPPVPTGPRPAEFTLDNLPEAEIEATIGSPHARG
jgi:hypothetical protein